MTVKFLFDFGSPNAYLAHRVIPGIESRTGAAFVYEPILLGGVFKLTGNQSPATAFFGIKNKPEYDRLEMRSASVAQVRASSLRLKVSLIYRRLRRTTARQEPDGGLTNATNFVSSMCTVRRRTVAKNVVSRRKIECTRRDLTL